MKVAVILSGCGVYDGAEIHESVLTLLALSRANVETECLAPDIPQSHVINHLTGEVASDEKRNVLVESARIARGKIKNLANAKASDYDAVFFPGGFGAAKNLSNFAFQGAQCQVQSDVLRFAQAVAQARIPACYMCIAPALAPLIYGKEVQVSIGDDAATAAAIQELGGQHITCSVHEIHVDQTHRLVSTPAYMLAGSISEAASGIDKAVAATLALVRNAD